MRNPDSLDQSWDIRTIMIAKLIPPGTSIIEFGAGRMVLRNHIPDTCTYTPSDIVNRGEGTIVTDLNLTPYRFINKKFDIAVFSGVLEYVYDLNKLISYLSEYVNTIIASYATADECDSIVSRRKSGWINDYRYDDLIALFGSSGYSCEHVEAWKQQTIFVFSKDDDERCRDKEIRAAHIKEMVNGLFTVIVPTFNRAKLITEALDSVKAQSYRPIEILVVDDGSSDNTKSVVETWTMENSEGDALSLRYFYQENAGPGAARNRGIQEIRGEYVQFLDSDDRLHHERLKHLAETFEHEQCDFIQTGFDGFDAEKGETIEVHYGRLKDDLISQALMGVLWPNTLRSAFRRTLVEKVGPWNTAMDCFEDYEYVIRALISSKKSFAVRDILASARRGGGLRVSDRLKTYEGRGYRIQCEKLVALLAVQHSDSLSHSVKCDFVARIYNLGVRSYASGWNDLALQCGAIAKHVEPIKINYSCLKWFYIWRLGVYGGRLYNLWNVAKKGIRPSSLQGHLS